MCNLHNSYKCRFHHHNGDCNFPKDSIIRQLYPIIICPHDFMSLDDYNNEVDKILNILNILNRSKKLKILLNNG